MDIYFDLECVLMSNDSVLQPIDLVIIAHHALCITLMEQSSVSNPSINNLQLDGEKRIQWHF